MNQVISCPHCGSPNPAGSAFCEACGKALPSAIATGPRVIAGDQLAMTPAGVKLQSDELHKQSKKAAGALLAVAIIQFIVGGILYVALKNVPPGRGLVINPAILLLSTAGVGVVFLGLYFWARRNPLPAAIVGLVVYITLTIIDLVFMLQMASQTPPGAQGPDANPKFNIPWMKIVIIAILVQAIQAGLKHRKLLEQQRQATPNFGGV